MVFVPWQEPGPSPRLRPSLPSVASADARITQAPRPFILKKWLKFVKMKIFQKIAKNGKNGKNRGFCDIMNFWLKNQKFQNLPKLAKMGVFGKS